MHQSSGAHRHEKSRHRDRCDVKSDKTPVNESKPNSKLGSLSGSREALVHELSPHETHPPLRTHIQNSVTEHEVSQFVEHTSQYH